MNVSLTPELERRISEKVESGLYHTASEVVREGLRRLFAEDESRQLWLARLDADIELGLAEADRGDTMPGDEARRLLQQRMVARRKAV